LRFHELELCQSVDAVFVFDTKGVEVWCLIEDERSYQRVVELLEPLRASFEVTLYTHRPPPPPKKGPDDKDPPPGIWNNAELREYLQDPFARGGAAASGLSVRPPAGEGTDPDMFLKQRMIMFADQTLDWGKMTHALPKSTRRFRPRDDGTPAASLAPPEDGAFQLAGAARSIARRVQRFVHPMNHTVGLVDLREPSLLDSLRTLRRMAGDFQRSLKSAR
jgi:hypothetical protein